MVNCDGVKRKIGKLTRAPDFRYLMGEMSAIPQPLAFTSAYRSLRPVEKQFVDIYVAQLERDAERHGERITLALHRMIPADVVDASGGLLEKPLVRAAITERIVTLAEQSELTVQRVIKEVMAIGFSSLGNYFEVEADGTVKLDFSRATPEQMSAVSAIEIDETISRTGMPSRKIKVKLHDKIAGLKMLMDYVGASRPDNPYWRADAPTAQPAALPSSASDADAADMYAQAING